VREIFGRSITRRGSGVVNGGPRLVRRGATDITAYREGFVESARIMKALGAEEAVNLDGGSTTMTIGPVLVNRPSDTTGERPIGDAVAVLP
jgi:exopolysaccharide biosynthesis protein